ncbi:MAG: DNA-processing protein DprA [Planctomycetota bacterium]
MDSRSLPRVSRQKSIGAEGSAPVFVRFLPGTDGRGFARLFALDGPPRQLFVAGTAPEEAWTYIAVVGSRRASVDGLQNAFALGRDLAAAGFHVISGLALGIDGSALEGALSVGHTPPAAILGNGLPEIYPPEHTGLAARLVEAGGFIATEQPPHSPPRRQNFPARNRLISGLSVAVVVVEASRRSGSLITANWALDQGREVLAFPGPATAPWSQGNLQLIKEGAVMVTDAAEVLGYLRLSAASGGDRPARRSD